ncbi:hypothetical protein EXIGLDRAFT_733175 [Exidia glandulosa HHB12029]|uniref:Uncharacterized protein n=1 Tax=Exidia glandulosa HHB12029 TaxID=1314781 RepID=A0A165KKX0_EXIGL|nr:hypothetical protein EXIGLDRAFT_733175 [Exidia glandulosa HHB12029]
MLRTRAASLSLYGATDLIAQLQSLEDERASVEQTYRAQLAALQAAHDAAVERISTKEHDLEAQRQRLRTAVLAKQAAFDDDAAAAQEYISRLPPELLSEIASHVVGTQSVAPVALVPLLLVSRMWKATLESTPSLWTCVSLPAAPSASSLRALRRQLDLARAAVLDVRVEAETCSPEHLFAYWAGMALLRAVLPRIRTLEITVRARTQLSDVLAHLSAPAPQLSRLIFHGPHGENIAYIPTGVLSGAQPETLVLQHACVPLETFVRPGLRHMDVSAVLAHQHQVDAIESSIELTVSTLETVVIGGSQWHSDADFASPAPGSSTVDAPRLTSLTLDNAPLSRLTSRLRAPALHTVALRMIFTTISLDFLEYAPNVEDLTLVDVTIRQSRPLRLLHLAKLVMKLDTGIPLLETLDAPGLAALDVQQAEATAEDADVFIHAVDRFVSRCPMLTSMTIGVRQPKDDVPLQFASVCPALTELHLVNMPCSLYLSSLPAVGTLTITGGSPDACILASALPEVRHLFVDGIDSVDAIVDQLRCDTSVWSSLETFELNHCPLTSGEALVEIVRLRRAPGTLRSAAVWSCSGVKFIDF